MDANQTACAPEARAYDLVLAYIKGEIAAGALKLGDKLPSERTRAAQGEFTSPAHLKERPGGLFSRSAGPFPVGLGGAILQ